MMFGAILRGMRSLLGYAGARMEERSTAAGIVGFALAGLHLALPEPVVGVIVNAIMLVGSVLAMVLPFGK